MTTQELHDMLTSTTSALKSAHEAVLETQRGLHLAHMDLTTAEQAHTLAGLEGKNAETRRAELANLTTRERNAVEQCELDHKNAQHNVTLAQLDHQLARNLLRLHTSTQEAHS